MTEQKKVLFIVYKTEWWGCLDSLCRQECREKGTTCYVMPVPRYERDPGTLEMNTAKKHYKPEQLAPMVPEGAVFIGNWEQFPMNQGFDKIYIHNPYDNANVMDTVDVLFYSVNLKTFTKKLIYVPHVLCFGGVPMEFNELPVYENVDAVYLPLKRAKYSLEQKYDGKVEAVPSGIPEYLDRIAAQIAEEKRQSGSREEDARKTLLYCVSFNNLYYGAERQIQKMWDIFEYARKNKDIRLIFRPDEDIPARFPWLHPSVTEGYKKLVAYFKKYNIGIYDQSPDVYRAAVEADGYMGAHYHSTLFNIQGKYVLGLDNIQRPVPSMDARCVPILWDAEVREDEQGIEILFVPDRTRLICRMRIPEEMIQGGGELPGKKKAKKHVPGVSRGAEVEVIAQVPDDVSGGLNYINIRKIGNCLYLIPYSSEGIWKYDMETRIFSQQYLPGADNMCMTATFSHGKYLYMIPRFYPGIVKYDTETEELEVLDGWIEELDRDVASENRKEPYFVWAVKQEGNMLYMASAKRDAWMEFDMDSDSWQVRSMNLPGRRFLDMVKDKDSVWLLPYCGNEILRWNRVTGEGCVLYYTVNADSKNAPYAMGLDAGDFVAAFPQQVTDHVLLIPKSLESRGEVTVSKGTAPLRERDKIVERKGLIPCGEGAFQSEYQRQRKTGYEFVKKLESGRILAYEYYDGSFLVLNDQLQPLAKIPCRLPAEAVREQDEAIWKEAQYRGEFGGNVNEGYSIPAMIDFFARHGGEDRDKIRRHYERFLEGLW